MRKHVVKIFLIGTACILFTGIVNCSGGSKGFSLARGKEKDLNTCLTMLKKKKHEEAIKCLEAYKSRNYGKPGAADADLAIGDAYFEQKDYVVAAEAYNLFIETYSFHERIPYAYFRAGVSYYKQAPKTVDRDLTYLEHAQKLFGAVITYYSASPYASEAKQFYDEVNSKMARQNFYVGRFYYKYRQYLASIPRFETIITDYPQSGFDGKSFFYLVSALKKTNQSDLAMKYFELYKKHYPDDMKNIKKMAALF